MAEFLALFSLLEPVVELMSAYFMGRNAVAIGRDVVQGRAPRPSNVAGLLIGVDVIDPSFLPEGVKDSIAQDLSDTFEELGQPEPVDAYLQSENIEEDIAASGIEGVEEIALQQLFKSIEGREGDKLVASMIPLRIWIDQFFDEVDTDKNGFISYDEFLDNIIECSEDQVNGSMIFQSFTESSRGMDRSQFMNMVLVMNLVFETSFCSHCERLYDKDSFCKCKRSPNNGRHHQKYGINYPCTACNERTVKKLYFHGFCNVCKESRGIKPTVCYVCPECHDYSVCKRCEDDDLPLLKNWKQEADGSIIGYISNSEKPSGMKITTSPVRWETREKGGSVLITTQSGSLYRLDMPVLKNWRWRSNRTIRGDVRNSKCFLPNERIDTSPIMKETMDASGLFVVATKSGTKYRLE
mmetsp:Transcript_1763/g.2097  ORF Transcript_1763/g.2097 Transcript_1763/m.2097 type:complete len:410 (+) Transcript_1763:84-1313(+)